MNIPIYYFKVDENDPEDGLTAIAMVDKPAILKQWLAFEEHEKKQPFQFSINEERRIVTSPIMIPDLPIYRKVMDKSGVEKEFYVAASKDTIEKLVMKFMREAKTNFIKSTHQQESDKTKGVFLFEMFISDEARGISQPKGFDLPDGTAFASIKVNNDAEWKKVKDGTFNGLSIEIFSEMIPTEIQMTDEQIISVIQSIIN